ncbi:metallophosphoesterase [Bacteroides sp. OttesenSCG-928-J23]|nr:metallophosphoesterase [Bacteroides sp. OttesenSCG-928-J23]
MDGPYLFHLPDGKVRVVSVAENGELKEEVLNKLPDNYSFRVFSHDKKHSFEVSIHPIIRQEWKQEAPEKLLAISDPHGNLTYFLSVLQANSVINDKYEWIYGKNHLMVNGDIFDRGDDVLPILWLMYKWDHEARVAGGAVHFLIGNHESMVLRGDLRYINDKYAKIATRLNIDYSKLFGADTELGRWIGSCNTIQIIGTDLFVHAGLSAGFYECSFSIPYVNSQFSEGVFLDKSGRENLSTHSKFLFSSSSSTVGGPGPLWYRGMVGYDGHEALDEDVLDLLLERYDVKRVIVGHTEQPDINLFYNGKVIAINVKSGNNYEKKLGRGILIEGVKTYVVNDEGTIKPL